MSASTVERLLHTQRKPRMHSLSPTAPGPLCKSQIPVRTFSRCEEDRPGFVGALLAIPATLFVKTLLQVRQETHFLVVLLSGQGDSGTTVTIPEDKHNESDTHDAKHTAIIVDSTEVPTDEE
jgi:hypothetical protein